jgi:uncharacterized membrane protein YfcA
MILYAVVAVLLMLAAFVAAMAGIGGGVLYTPLQVLLGVDIHSAATNGLFLIIILSLSATRIYHRKGRIDWRLVLVLEIFTAAGGFAGGYLSDFIPSVALIVLLACVVTAAGICMLLGKQRSNVHADGAAWYLWHRAIYSERYTINMLVAIPLSFAAGAVSGMVGIGGGVIKVPMLALIFGVPIDIAVASSIVMVGITAAGGFAGHMLSGHLDWKLVLLCAPAVFAGAWVGAHTMTRMNKRQLKTVVGIVMLAIALGLMVKLIVQSI